MTDKMFPDVPEAVTDNSRGFSVIWLIPLIAVLVAGWLAYKTFTERGPEITIVFDEAEGLEPGQTRIKYKDVDVGKISRVGLTDDLKKVKVTARLNANMSEHLNDRSRFWIVRPRVSSSGISGLSTLISGIHIAMDPGDGESSVYYFHGLSSPPEIESNAEGEKYTLTADSLGSLDRGSPVYYRQIQVGEVTQYTLAKDGQSIDINIFVSAPYHRLINADTRFWNASGFNLEVGTSGITAEMESLGTLVSGGIAFETPISLNSGGDNNQRQRFPLHATYAESKDEPYDNTELYVMYFDGSLRGLNKGATVEFRGIEVGKVLDVDVRLNPETLDVEAPVLVELHPETITKDADRPAREILENWFRRGLRAQLSTSNLLTGSLYIDLVLAPQAEAFAPQPKNDIPVFPTIAAEFDRLTETASATLEKINQIPIVEISNELLESVRSLNQLVDSGRADSTISTLNATLQDIHQLVATLNETLPGASGNIEQTLSELQTSLKGINQVLGPDSGMSYELHDMVSSLKSSARSLDALLKQLENHPNSLIFGRPDSN
ncbi:MlaD family protein [Granulosicoccaceae sp. 1_MG-2023]|nr:MlaD family protein [Granulosicoccaceae sp. 1_MG-2023]